jgi:hypothetical protein
MKTKPDLNTLILLLILAVLVVGGVVFAQALRRVAQPFEQAEQSVMKELQQLRQPTPTVLPDPMTIIHEVRALSRLETASYSVEKVITAESGQGALAFLTGDRLILVAHGQVIAGVDLARLGDNGIVVATDGSVVVLLPPAEVFVATLDNRKSYIYDRDTGVIGLNPSLESAARQAAEEEIRQAALEDGILALAEQNAQATVRGLLRGLGFEQVTFARAASTPPTPTAEATP